MANRITLPSGAWIDLRDIDSFRRRDTDRILTRTEEINGPNPSEIAHSLAVRQATTEAIIEGWSFDCPIPSVDPAGLDDLTLPDSRLLDEQLGVYTKALFPDFSPSTDPGSPT